MANVDRPSSSTEFIAGFVAGVASTLIVHPLDLIKTRLQVDRSSASRAGASVRVTKEIFNSRDGFIAAFYRGLTPNLVGNSLSWALYFVCYGKIKSQLHTYHGSNAKLSYSDFLVASGLAGIVTAVVTNPIWVIKTRMLSTSSKYPGAYTSISDGVQQIFFREGTTGFYRGLIPSLVGVSHGALQFMAYEELKIYRRSSAAYASRDLNALDFVALSGLAKVFAGSITYPYQVVRARLQMYDAARTSHRMSTVLLQVLKQEGFTGFYKGLGPYLLRVMPSTWVTFVVYEITRLYFPKLFNVNTQT